MIKNAIQYIWGRKFGLILIILLIVLLPNGFTRELQVYTTQVITQMNIDINNNVIDISAKQLKPSPDEKTTQYEEVTFNGTDIKQILSDVSLSHCNSIEFQQVPNIELLKMLYDYNGLRSNTLINNKWTLDELIKNPDYRYQLF